MKKIYLSVLSMFVFMSSQAQLLTYESFEDFSALAGDGWEFVNVSDPVGTGGWSGNGGVIDLGALSLPGYASTSFAATTEEAAGDISDWMISPTLTVSNGDEIRFYALSFNSANFPDRLHVRLSTEGASSTLPASYGDVGSFTTTLFTINPDLDNESFPSVVGAENGWTLFTVPVTGVGTDVSCRIAFHYDVPDGGGLGSNSSSIGVDEFYLVGPEGYVGVEENLAEGKLSFFPNPANEMINLTYNNLPREAFTTRIFDMSGKLVLSQNFVSQGVGITSIDTNSLENGIYTVQVQNESSSYTTRVVVSH